MLALAASQPSGIPGAWGGAVMLADLKLRDDPPQPNDHGYVSKPRPTRHQFGTVIGLPQRLAEHIRRLGTDRSLPWVGLGLINDLEIAVQLLNMREFAEWLRTKGDPAHARFADEIIDAQDALAIAGYHTPSLAENVSGLDDENRENEQRAMVLDEVRKVLVQTGALAADDKDTPLPDLVRALLS